MFLSPTTAICDSSIRRHLVVIPNIVTVAVVAPSIPTAFTSTNVLRESLRRRRRWHDGVKSIRRDGNGRDAMAMTSATAVMEIRGSVRLFWNDDNGHEVNPNSFWYYCGTLSLRRVRRQDTLGLVPTQARQCDPDECRSRPMTR
jgi:hypothetical protein